MYHHSVQSFFKILSGIQKCKDQGALNKSVILSAIFRMHKTVTLTFTLTGWVFKLLHMLYEKHII
jgi:hypothetical protein